MNVRQVLENRPEDDPLRKRLEWELERRQEVRELCDRLQMLTGFDPLTLPVFERYYIDLKAARIELPPPIDPEGPLAFSVSGRAVFLGPTVVYYRQKEGANDGP